jgi:hypothetical protein
MDNPSIDSLARRLEELERENRRWRFAACVASLGIALSFALGGFFGPRAVVAQQPERKAVVPGPVGLEYKVTDEIFPNQMEKPLRELASDGWEVLQVVPSQWTGSGSGAGGYSKVRILARRQLPPAR